MNWHKQIIRRKKRKGSSLVEFALVFPIFMMMVFATMDFARYAYMRHVMTHVAREGLRVGFTGRQLQDRNNPATTLSRYNSIVQATLESSERAYGWLLDINHELGSTDNTMFIEFSSNNGATWAAGAGNHQDMLRVRLIQRMNFITPFLSQLTSGGGPLEIRVSMTQRNLGNPDSFLNPGDP